MSIAMRVIGYARCSTLEQSTDGLSLDVQRAKIEAWAEMAGAELVDVIEDEAVGGGRPLADRPGGSQIAALLDSRRPEVDAVVIVRLDRLGRDAAETLACLRRFQTGRVGLVSIVDRVDLSSPQGRAMAAMGAVFAELEKSLIGQRTADALTLLKKQGRVYGPVPYGYRSENGALLKDEAEQRVLVRILARRRKGESYRRIAEALNRKGTVAKRGGCWSGMSVRSVVRTYDSMREAA